MPVLLGAWERRSDGLCAYGMRSYSSSWNTRQWAATRQATTDSLPHTWFSIKYCIHSNKNLNLTVVGIPVIIIGFQHYNNIMFDFNNVVDFDTHIRLSIPNYDQLFDTFKSLATIYSEPDTTVIDFGCSTGRFIIELPKKVGCEYCGVDMSTLVPVSPFNSDPIYFFKEDAVKYRSPKIASVVVSMFFLQFLSKKKRCEMLSVLRSHVDDGATLLISEKIALNDSKIDNIISRLHMAEKRKSFTDTEILDKDRQILESMYPVDRDTLMDELYSIGSIIIPVWQSYNFCGFVVKK
jgi:SAM-dependent methyltransferase